jgi:hypothetical protein
MLWLALLGFALGLAALAWGYGRAARKDESVARVNRTGVQDETFGSSAGTHL